MKFNTNEAVKSKLDDLILVLNDLREISDASKFSTMNKNAIKGENEAIKFQSIDAFLDNTFSGIKSLCNLLDMKVPKGVL